MDKRGFTYAEARGYLGLKRRAFEKHIRPRLPPPTRCGTCLVFERVDLDCAWDAYRATQLLHNHRQRSRSALDAATGQQTFKDES